MQQKETPIFFDQSGKRWKITEFVLAVILLMLAVASFLIIPQVLAMRRPPNLVQHMSHSKVTAASVRSGETSISQLMTQLSAKNIPAIGTGPLVRLVRLISSSDGTYVTEPFTHEILQKLSDTDTRILDGDDYALQHYGSGKDKRMVLTFDDGPDAIYTPQLLDLLSREGVPSTFFVIGSNAAKYPELMKRITSEGHTVGNHTFSHIHIDTVSELRGVEEINQTERLIVATTGKDTAFFRPPYMGDTDQSLRNNLKSILTAQKSGYTIASHDFDSDDWRFPTGKKQSYPELDGSNIVVLLHDSGGDRSRTVAYTEKLIRLAKSKGYTFTTLDGLYSVPKNTDVASASLADNVSMMAAQAVYVWPRHLITGLFIFSIASLILISVVNIFLAIVHMRKTRHKVRSKKFTPQVTIIMPAYNEQEVIEKSVRSLIRSQYRKIKIIIVDDGSSDDTWKVARSLDKRYKRVTALHQENGGKATALNNGINYADTAEIVICMDADTLFPPETIKNFVRHFEDASVAAVAGVVKVGNPHNMLTKWQAMEYATGISIDRNAQALLGAITIVPGACGAWRRSVLLELGGFSTSTLAEDCDIALKIQRTGRYKILQDNEAMSYTEAPQSFLALTKQRFRWTYGNIQALWKHRSMIFNKNYGWLGMYILPSAIISIAVPILFWPLLTTITIDNMLTGNFQSLVLFFGLSLIVQGIISAIGLMLAKERYLYLIAIPMARIAYGPIRIYILYKTVLTILKGVDVGWNKLARTGTAFDPTNTVLELAAVPSKKA